MSDIAQETVNSVQSSQIALILQRLGQIEGKIDRNYDLNSQEFTRIHAELTDHENRIRDLERDTTAISARLTLSQIIQTTFAAVAAALAGAVGIFFK